jgi:hypothetical protein
MLLPFLNGSLKIACGLQDGTCPRDKDHPCLLLLKTETMRASIACHDTYYRMTSLSSPGAWPVLEPS